MKTIKILSVIGLIWFGLMFLNMVGWTYETADQAIGYGVLAIAYGIALAIVALVQVNKISK